VHICLQDGGANTVFPYTNGLNSLYSGLAVLLRILRCVPKRFSESMWIYLLGIMV
jgi:hypothetical protein